MEQERRVSLFDRWAADYDHSVRSGDDFPFAGYEDVLNAMAECVGARPDMRVLELGIGTGNLAERLMKAQCDVWGIDFSVKMLARVKQRLPQVHVVQADLLGELPEELPAEFDRVVSAYLLHEFDLARKVELLARMARDYLGRDGLMIVGDIAFPSIRERELAHRRWKDLWDEDEDYWAADEAIGALEKAGLRAEYRQVSTCAGIMVISPAPR